MPDKLIYACAVLVAAIVILAYIIFFVYKDEIALIPGMVNPPANQGRIGELCNTSSSIIKRGNSTNYIVLNVTVYIEGGKCMVREEVLQDANSGMAGYNLTGYNITCNLSYDELRKFGMRTCQGSISSFASALGSGASGGTVTVSGKILCSLYDAACKERMLRNIKQCGESEMLDDALIGEDLNRTSYWTLYINIGKPGGNCEIYYEVVNIANLPPEIPPNVKGMNMTCRIPLSNFPIQYVTVYWCDGSLEQYIEYI
jgi:hypothetical protein